MLMFKAKLTQFIVTLSPAKIAQLNRALAQALELPEVEPKLATRSWTVLETSPSPALEAGHARPMWADDFVVLPRVRKAPEAARR